MKFFFKSKNFIILFLISLIGFLLCRFLFDRNPPSLQKGYISNNENAQKMYYQTLIDTFVPDLAWKPTGEYKDTDLEIGAKSALLVDAESGQILFEKNPNEIRQIASLTKIMTAVVTLEHKDLFDKILVSEKAASINENRMGIDRGEEYTVDELLYGLVLHSGNDAAFALSEGVAGDTDTFVAWMNIKAKELGLGNTAFFDPSGLDDRNKSTVTELVKLTRYALKNPKFREIVKTDKRELSYNGLHKYLPLENQTNLLTSYPGVLGVKTGYTEEAGLCLVTYAVNSGKEVLGVVLNSGDRKGDMILMLDKGFSSMGITVEHHLLD